MTKNFVTIVVMEHALNFVEITKIILSWNIIFEKYIYEVFRMLSATGINQDRANKCGSQQGWERKNHLPSALGGLTLGTHWWILDCNCDRHTNGKENLDIIHQKKKKKEKGKKKTMMSPTKWLAAMARKESLDVTIRDMD